MKKSKWWFIGITIALAILTFLSIFTLAWTIVKTNNSTNQTSTIANDDKEDSTIVDGSKEESPYNLHIDVHLSGNLLKSATNPPKNRFQIDDNEVPNFLPKSHFDFKLGWGWQGKTIGDFLETQTNFQMTPADSKIPGRIQGIDKLNPKLWNPDNKAEHNLVWLPKSPTDSITSRNNDYSYNLFEMKIQHYTNVWFVLLWDDTEYLKNSNLETQIRTFNNYLEEGEELLNNDLNKTDPDYANLTEIINRAKTVIIKNNRTNIPEEKLMDLVEEMEKLIFYKDWPSDNEQFISSPVGVHDQKVRG